MNQHLITATSGRRSPNLFVDLSGINYDRRSAKYVESTCATLIENRFGPGCASEFAIVLADPPVPGADVFCDLNDRETVPWYALSHDGRDRHLIMVSAKTNENCSGAIDRSPGRCACDHASDAGRGRGSPF